MSFKIFGNNFG
jgi:hypothetical protein